MARHKIHIDDFDGVKSVVTLASSKKSNKKLEMWIYIGKTETEVIFLVQFGNSQLGQIHLQDAIDLYNSI